MQHEKSATWNQCNMEKVQHENSRGVARTPGTFKIENFATMFNDFGNYSCKPSHRRCLWGSWQQFWKQCIMNKMQQEKIAKWGIATREECKTKTL